MNHIFSNNRGHSKLFLVVHSLIYLTITIYKHIQDTGFLIFLLFYHFRNEKKVIDLNKPMRPGAFVDVSRVKKYTEQDYLLPEEPAFSWLLTKKVQYFDALLFIYCKTIFNR